MAAGNGGSGAMSLVLTLEQGPRAQAVRQTRLDSGELVIGRSPDADWQIDDPDMFVSRAHCKIVAGQDGYFVTDTSSSGLFIDNAGSPLGAGNSVRLAKRHAAQDGRLRGVGRSAKGEHPDGCACPTGARAAVAHISSAGEHRAGRFLFGQDRGRAATPAPCQPPRSVRTARSRRVRTSQRRAQFAGFR